MPDEKAHDCYQKERLNRVDKFLFGNGQDGMVQIIARMDVRLAHLARSNRYMATTWLSTVLLLVGKLAYDHFTQSH